MNSYRKFLSWYSVMMTTVLFGGSLVFIPRPENFLFLVLFLPTCLYFWLNIKRRVPTKQIVSDTANSDQPAVVSHREKPRWLALIMLTIIFTLFISNLSIYLYSKLGKAYFPLVNNLLESQTETSQNLEDLKQEVGKLPADSEANKQILQQLTEIKDEINSLKNSPETKAPVLGVTATPPEKADNKTTSLVTLLIVNDVKWGQVEVFQDKTFSSQVVGKLSFGKNYPYTEKEGSWYFVSLPDKQQGWVNNRFVNEVNAQ